MAHDAALAMPLQESVAESPAAMAPGLAVNDPMLGGLAGWVTVTVAEAETEAAPATAVSMYVVVMGGLTVALPPAHGMLPTP
jgi:hypothetical protein